VSAEEHLSFLIAEGWSPAEWEHGVKASLKDARVQQHFRGVMSGGDSSSSSPPSKSAATPTATNTNDPAAMDAAAAAADAATTVASSRRTLQSVPTGWNAKDVRRYLTNYTTESSEPQPQPPQSSQPQSAQQP
jgi:hypothetical protein